MPAATSLHPACGRCVVADIADRANDYAEQDLAHAIAAARKPLAKGKPGDCDLCGEWSSRLVDGACAPCRDIEDRRLRQRIGR